MTRGATIVAALAMALAPIGAGAAPLKIVATFTILADMVRQVAGPHAEVVSLVGPGGDAHTFNPSPADAGKLTDADLIFANGFGLDGWIARLAASADFKGRLITASMDVTPREMTEAVGGVSRLVTDPHAWQDPRNGGLYIRAIEFALTEADAPHTLDYRRAADALVADLDALDEGTRKRLASIVPERRKLITSHDAFGYFGRAYGVELLAPEGISTDQEPSAAAVARLIDQIRAEHIKAVFIENMGNPRLIETIRADTGIATGGTLYSDSLSPPGGPAASYLAMLRYNIEKFVTAMTAKAP